MPFVIGWSYFTGLGAQPSIEKSLYDILVSSAKSLPDLPDLN